jgi:photosystem II stability/assembly factor-like uncharacterized protein
MTSGTGLCDVRLSSRVSVSSVALTAMVAVMLGGCGGQHAARSFAATHTERPGQGASATPRQPRMIPQSVSFTTRSLGWTWGPAGRSLAGRPPARGVLARTSDGGHTWSVIATPRIAYAGVGYPGGVAGVRFADRLDGYLFGGELWATADGGGRWRRLHTPGTILDLQSGAGRAYALALDCASSMDCDSAHLYRVAGAGLARIGPRSSVDARRASLVVRGPAVYLLTPSPQGRTSLRPATLLASSNCGRSWQRLSTPCGWDGALGGALATWSRSGLVLACGGEPGAGNQPKTFYASTDLGRRWRLSGRLAFSPGYIASLATADSSTWALGEARGTIDVTHDGGHNWHAAAFGGVQAPVEGWATSLSPIRPMQRPSRGHSTGRCSRSPTTARTRGPRSRSAPASKSRAERKRLSLDRAWRC